MLQGSEKDANDWAGGHDAWIDQVGSAIQCGHQGVCEEEQGTNDAAVQGGGGTNHGVHKECISKDET